MRIITLLMTFFCLSSCSTVNPGQSFITTKSVQFKKINLTKTKDTKCDEYYVYLETANNILSQYNTKMTGQMMADAWHSTLENYGVDVPIKLALAQAHLESGFCTSELSKQRNNPYSLKSGKSYSRYVSLQQGIESYYKLIAKKYLGCKNLEQLLKNFSTCDGYRYAGSKNYEIKLKNQMQKYDVILANR